MSHRPVTTWNGLAPRPETDWSAHGEPEITPPPVGVVDTPFVFSTSSPALLTAEPVGNIRYIFAS